MCGIIGYNGSDDAIPYLLDGIKNLEYRGYDSFGCAMQSGDNLIIKKDVGMVDDVIKKYRLYDLSSNKAVFHTRWATHGGVEQKNAHPIPDCSGRLAVAHNGIIENWAELKNELSGHEIKSDTDTEVLSHLIEDRLDAGDDLKSAVKATFERISGASSFIVIDTKTDDLIGVKKGSPLVLGLADNGNFISSDVPSFIKYTNKVIYLYDGDMVSVGKKGYDIVNLMGKNHSHEISTPNFSVKDIDKGDYEHFMLKEIMEQPRLINALKEKSFSEIDPAVNAIKGAGSIYIVGAGTSFHVALLGARVFRENGMSAIPLQGQDLPSYKNAISNKDIFIIISQSGETADIINSLPIIKGNTKIGIINNEESTLAKEVNIVIPLKAGPEKAVAATKTFTLSAFYTVFLAMAAAGKKEMAMNDINLLDLNLYNLFVPSVIDAVDSIAETLKNLESIFLLGRDYDYIVALEGALKFKEITYIHAEAVDASTFKHGPLALISDKAYAIGLVSEAVKSSTLSNLQEVKARKGNIIGIADSNSELFDMFIRVPEGGIFNFIPQVMILQLLSYKTAVLKGIDMDHPRNLAKTVTVL